MNIKMLINNKNICIVSFLIICIVKLLYSSLYVVENTSYVSIRIISLLIYFLLSYYAYKNNIVASILMAIIILFTGFGLLALAILISKTQFLMRATSLVVGVYFAYGGTGMLLSLRARKKK